MLRDEFVAKRGFFTSVVVLIFFPQKSDGKNLSIVSHYFSDSDVPSEMQEEDGIQYKFQVYQRDI